MARRYALVIGIGENEAPLASLSKPVEDARAIAAVLRSVGGFEVQECVGRVERQELERAIERLLEQAEGQEALIYYTGHAVPLRKAFGQMEALLAGSDCVVVAEDGMAVQQRNGLSLGDLNQVLGAANLGNLVLLLDCCHSGYLLEKQLLQQTFTNFAKKDYLLITACRSFEQAYANRSDRHSIFTGAVLEGLGRENGDEQGVVTGDRLFAFVSRRLEGTGQEALRLSVGRPIELVRYPLETISKWINLLASPESSVTVMSSRGTFPGFKITDNNGPFTHIIAEERLHSVIQEMRVELLAAQDVRDLKILKMNVCSILDIVRGSNDRLLITEIHSLIHDIEAAIKYEHLNERSYRPLGWAWRTSHGSSMSHSPSKTKRNSVPLTLKNILMLTGILVGGLIVYKIIKG